MKRSHCVLAAALLVLFVGAPAWSAPVPAEKSPIAWIPASAPAVLHLNGLHNLRDHLVAFLRIAEPNAADSVQKFSEDFFQNGFSGHKIRGVPKNGVVFLVCMDLNTPLVDDSPAYALIAAVDDYKEFRDNLLVEGERKILKSEEGYESTILDFSGKTCFFVDKKDHVVLTPSKKLAVAFAKEAPGLDGRMSKAQAERFLKSDLGFFWNMDVFSKDYADMVKSARERVNDLIKNTEQLPDRSMKRMAALAKDAVGPLFQAVDDSQGILYTLDIHPEGLVMHVESEVRTGSKTGMLLKDFKPTAFNDLDKMPPGQIYYVGMQTVPSLFRMTGTMMFSSLTDPDSQESKAIDDAVEEMLKAGPSACLMGVSVPPSGVEVWQFDDPAKAVGAQAKLIEATGAGLVRTGILREKPEIKPHAQKYRGFDFTSVRVAWDLDKMLAAADPAPNQAGDKKAALTKLLGDGLRLWFGSDGKTFLQVTAPDWDGAQKQIDAYFKGDHVISDDGSFGRARKEMPAETTVLLLIDVLQYAELLDAAKPVLGVGVLKPPAGLKGKSRYLGLAATLQPERAALDVYIPAEAVELVYRVFIQQWP